MLQIINKTPFETGFNFFTDKNGEEKVSVAVKATFNIPEPDETIKISEQQLPVFETTQYYGKPGQSSVKYPVDIVLEKINSDIGLTGSIHTPGNKPVQNVLVSLQVGRYKKDILIWGDRYWKKKLFFPGFYMTEPEFFTEMPLIYERAFGGFDIKQKNKKAITTIFESNPIGTGFRNHKQSVNNHKLPNLEHPDHLIKSWKDKPDPAGFGFIDPAWGSLKKYAGTYDENWQKSQSPLLPKDFDNRFFNTASAGLVVNGFLKGDEPIVLCNLCKNKIVQFNLPAIKINSTFKHKSILSYEALNIWTILFEPDENRFMIVYGISFKVGKELSRVEYCKLEMSDSSS